MTIIVIIFLIYVAATAASFPGTMILTLAAGAIFGVVTGIRCMNSIAPSPKAPQAAV